LERLGWAFVAKARASFDPGYYKLAEQCAQSLESRAPGGPEAKLLRGHVLHQLHRFHEAEPIARELTTIRGLPYDYALLGDVMLELGRVDAAVDAYQQMLDSRPDPQGYARAAHLRWVKGDLEGATEMMQTACSSISSRAEESVAWMHTRLGILKFQVGDAPAAEQACETALACRPDYPPALLLRGRILMAQDHTPEAAKLLRQAAVLNPLPEYQWTLLEALHSAGCPSEAAEVETQLVAQGERTDPRTFSVYLSTQGAGLESALRLAEKEIEERQDVFTYDALAWALLANGRDSEAWSAMQRALAECTVDARLFLHRAVIAARIRHKDAGRWLAQAQDLSPLLLPSERKHLEQSVLFLAQNVSSRPVHDAR
jgi:tetratricopeptide (TPR) repeat protein